MPRKHTEGFPEQVIDGNAAAVLKQNEREKWHAVAREICCTLCSRDLDAATPCLDRASFIAGQQHHLTQMPPTINASWVVGQVIAQQRNVARDLVVLSTFVTKMMKPNVAEADIEAIAAANGIDSIVHSLVNHPAEADAGIVAKKAKLRVRRPSHPRIKT